MDHRDTENGNVPYAYRGAGTAVSQPFSVPSVSLWFKPFARHLVIRSASDKIPSASFANCQSSVIMVGNRR